MANNEYQFKRYNASNTLSTDFILPLENGETSFKINEQKGHPENRALKGSHLFKDTKELNNGNNGIDSIESLNFTSEERKRRRQEISERQRNASLSSQKKQQVTSTENEVVSLERENSSQSSHNINKLVRTYVINDAIDFVNNPKLLKYPLDQRINFLKTKGLSSQEIRSALNKLGSKTLSNLGAINSAMPPPLPPRLYLKKGNNTFLPLSLFLKQLSFLLLISSGVSCAFVLAFKKYALPFLNKIFNARSWILENRKKQFTTLETECSNLDNTFQKFNISNEAKSNSVIVEQDNSKEKDILLLSSILTKRDKIAKTVYSMNSGQNKRVERTACLMKDISGLMLFYLNRIPDHSQDPMVWNCSDSPAAGLKSEIRGLKGILLKNTIKLV